MEVVRVGFGSRCSGWCYQSDTYQLGMHTLIIRSTATASPSQEEWISKESNKNFCRGKGLDFSTHQLTLHAPTTFLQNLHSRRCLDVGFSDEVSLIIQIGETDYSNQLAGMEIMISHAVIFRLSWETLLLSSKFSADSSRGHVSGMPPATLKSSSMPCLR